MAVAGKTLKNIIDVLSKLKGDYVGIKQNSGKLTFTKYSNKGTISLTADSSDSQEFFVVVPFKSLSSLRGLSDRDFNIVVGSTLQFKANDIAYEIPLVDPEFAIEVNKDNLITSFNVDVRWLSAVLEAVEVAVTPNKDERFNGIYWKYENGVSEFVGTNAQKLAYFKSELYLSDKPFTTTIDLDFLSIIDKISSIYTISEAKLEIYDSHVSLVFDNGEVTLAKPFYDMPDYKFLLSYSTNNHLEVNLEDFIDKLELADEYVNIKLDKDRVIISAENDDNTKISANLLAQYKGEPLHYTLVVDNIVPILKYTKKYTGRLLLDIYFSEDRLYIPVGDNLIYLSVLVKEG